MPYLAITTKQGFEKEWQFDGLDVLTIGRAPTNDIILADEGAKVSRYHACVVRCEAEQSRYFLRDLGSLHLTKVGGIPITQHPLTNGDLIEIGPYKLIYTDSDSHLSKSFDENDDLLTIVDKGTGGSLLSDVQRAQGQTTEPLPPCQLLEGVALTTSQQELCDEFLRKACSTRELPGFFAAIMPHLAKVFEASSGFVALFADGTIKGYRPLAVYGLDPKKGKTLQITSRTFLDDIRKGQPIVESKVMLAPMKLQDRVAGFLCLGWVTRTVPISRSEVEVLCLLGRLTSVIKSHDNPQTDPVPSPAFTNLAWPWPTTLIGKSALAQTLREELLTAAGTDENVLLIGPTGTGKEVAAKTLQQNSMYTHGPYRPVNCSNLGTEMFAETQLFGYEAKSGIADGDPNGKPGFFESTDGGVLFLDEVHTLPENVQAKLLRVLEEKEVLRFASRIPRPVRIKVVAATNEDPQRSLTFRTDLFYRFGRRIRLASLAERSDDIPLLVHYFLDRFASEYKRPPVSISRQTLQQLMRYEWPGNIRELQGYAKRFIEMKKDFWFSSDLPAEMQRVSGTNGLRVDRPMSMKEVEKAHIMEVLEHTRGNKSEAARILGFQSRQTLLNKMDEHHIGRTYGTTVVEGPRVAL